MTLGQRSGGRQIIPRPAAWEPGPPAPWPAGVTPSLTDLVARVHPDERALVPAFPDARNSAVLIVLHDAPSGPEVLLTRRSWALNHHRGEISFPGGRVDPGETPTEAALREANEEVGLDPDLVVIQGELPHLNTVVSRSYIVPKVATIPERPVLTPHPSEVDRILWVPLAELTRPGTYHAERWGIDPLHRVLHFFVLDDETVWGATAHMLVDLLRRAVT